MGQNAAVRLLTGTRRAHDVRLELPLLVTSYFENSLLNILNRAVRALHINSYSQVNQPETTVSSSDPFYKLQL